MSNQELSSSTGDSTGEQRSAGRFDRTSTCPGLCCASVAETEASGQFLSQAIAVHFRMVYLFAFVGALKGYPVEYMRFDWGAPSGAYSS